MNNITIAGTCGKDSELRAVGQDQILSFSVAASQGREKPTIWWNCQLWGRRATSLQEYILKGTPLTVSGRIEQREYTDKNGEKKTVMQVNVSDIALQGKREQSPAKPQQEKPAKQAKNGSGFEDMDDDIPF